MDFNFRQNVNTDWPTWKNYLKNAMEFAEELGIAREKINSLAYQVGDLLAQSVPPSNPEQQAIKELWQVADPNERQVLARLMTKVVSQ
ncbi:DUF3243 domain-containing protein [Desulfallas thermosapovorans]|uniref:Uncharacterized protein DUF3243 n=1 Tax=Desulfallas thermosapovorans DSM 6562 TaxID=1121431 RepID=A0A5S4ZSL5_9FIRM|nr:DUF3243 domain-containing protein [Desulfallas thermosapovorans]TYO95648.1 uncharacterized protein DUF3243 [Desulfallas thermosapovorans DSM 6562]